MYSEKVLDKKTIVNQDMDSKALSVNILIVHVYHLELATSFK